MRNISIVIILLFAAMPFPSFGITLQQSNLVIDTIGFGGAIHEIEVRDGYLYCADAGSGINTSPDAIYRINLQDYSIDTILLPSDFYPNSYPLCFTWNYDSSLIIADGISWIVIGKIYNYKNGSLNILTESVGYNYGDLLLLEDSSILVSDRGYRNGTNDGFLFRLLNDGTLEDTLFSIGDYYGMCFDYDGSILLGCFNHFGTGEYELLRLNETDTTLIFYGHQDISIQPNRCKIAIPPPNHFRESIYLIDQEELMELRDNNSDGIPDENILIATCPSAHGSIAFDAAGNMYVAEHVLYHGTNIYRIRELKSWYVSTAGDDFSGDGSESLPFATIQYAISMAVDGDTILVYDGIYTGDGNRDIDIFGKAIVVMSESGPENTIIDCQGDPQNLHRGFYLHSSEDSNTVISGFTVRNAYNEYGGAIYCASSTKISPCIFAKIQNCIFANNHAGVGGGIYCGYRSFPQIVDCLFLNNSYSGIYFYDGAASLIGCTFFGNSGSNIYITGEAPKVKDKNRAELIIQNCNITYSKSGYGIRRDNAYIPQLSCNNIYGNCDGESIGVNLFPENNNISADPLYCDTINYNFSVVNTSPCLPQNNNCNVLIGSYGMGCYDLITDLGLKNEDVNHVLGHNPIIYWSYYDIEMNPQDSFEVEVGTDMDWSYAEMWNPAAFPGADTTIMYGGSPLLDNETYYYRVRVNNSQYWSIWHYSYFHMNSIPSIPIAVRPVNDTILLDYQPTLWIYNSTDGEIDDTLTYDFVVANDTTFGEPDPVWDDSVAEGTDSTGWQVTEPLNENWHYFWSARAFDQYEYSDWSETQTFWVNAIEEAPGDFETFYPPDTDEVKITDMLTLFWWGEADEPDPLDSVQYTLYISLDSNFEYDKEIDSIWTNLYTLTVDDSLEFGTHYWWKVKATDNTGRSTYSTNIRDFQTWMLGDANGDLQVNILDVTFLINYLYKGGAPPWPIIMGDIDSSCSINILDVTYLINYLYKDGPAPLVGCE